MKAFALVVTIAIVVCGSAQHKRPTLTGEAILKHLEANFTGIQDYTVRLEATVDIDRMKVPQMKATMYFKQPDKVHFVSDGFALLPKEGVGFNPSKLSERFDVESVNVDISSQRYTLTVRPKNDKTRLRRVFLTVDPQTWVVEEILTPQFDGRQMRAQFEYQHIETHALPSQITVTFTTDTTRIDTPAETNPHQRPSSMPRSGTIIVRYLDYKLNTGLKDELFQTNKSK
jgi:outer membrane lipoprotein-sorting protein